MVESRTFDRCADQQFDLNKISGRTPLFPNVSSGFFVPFPSAQNRKRTMKKPKSKQHGDLQEKEGLAKTKSEPPTTGESETTTFKNIRVVFATPKKGRGFVITGVRSPKQLAQERRDRCRAEQKSERPKKSLREVLHDAALHLMSLLPELSSEASLKQQQQHPKIRNSSRHQRRRLLLGPAR